MLDLFNQFKDFKSLEVSFKNSNNEPQKNFCTIKSIEPTSIILNANNQENKNIFAEVGNELKLYIYTDSGIYSATAKVLLLNKGILNTEYVITYPVNTKHSQRREFYRADMSVNFDMSVITSIETESKIIIEAKTKNICGKGMSFVTANPFPEHEKIELELHFAEKTVPTAAKLVYSKPFYKGTTPAFVHAFVFVDIAQRNIDFIVKQCFIHQLEMKKKTTF